MKIYGKKLNYVLHAATPFKAVFPGLNYGFKNEYK